MYTYWTTPPPVRLFWMAYLAFFSNPQCEYWNTIESVANPDPLVRSSGRVHNAALYRSARPDLRIRTGHWMQYNRIEEYRSGNLHSKFCMIINRPKIQNFLIVSFCRLKQDDTQAFNQWWRRLNTSGVRQLWIWKAYWGETAQDNDNTLGVCS